MKCVLFNSIDFCPCRSCLSGNPADGVCWRTQGLAAAWESSSVVPCEVRSGHLCWGRWGCCSSDLCREQVLNSVFVKGTTRKTTKSFTLLHPWVSLVAHVCPWVSWGGVCGQQLLGCSLHRVGHSTAVWERRGCCGFSGLPLALCCGRRRAVVRVFAQSSGQQDLQENHPSCPRAVAFGGYYGNNIFFLTEWGKTAPPLTSSIARISVPHHFQLVPPETALTHASRSSCRCLGTFPAFGFLWLLCHSANSVPQEWTSVKQNLQGLGKYCPTLINEKFCC